MCLRRGELVRTRRTRQRPLKLLDLPLVGDLRVDGCDLAERIIGLSPLFRAEWPLPVSFGGSADLRDLGDESRLTGFESLQSGHCLSPFVLETMTKKNGRACQQSYLCDNPANDSSFAFLLLGSCRS